MRIVREVAGKIAHLVLVLFLVSAGTFVLTEAAGGDPAVAILGPNAPREQYDRLEAELGLDQPVPVRYLRWLGDAVRGDLGTTLVPPVESVAGLVGSRLPVTVEIALLAMLVALLIAVPVGTWSAYRAGTATESVTTAGTFAVLSVPSFFAALLLIWSFVLHRPGTRVAVSTLGFLAAGAVAVHGIRTVARARRSRRPTPLPIAGLAIHALAIAVLVVLAATIREWFPELPRQGLVRLTDPEGVGAHLRSLALPVLALGMLEGMILLRVLRSDLITILAQDHVLAARAKGLPVWRVLLGALRPASLSLVTMAGVSLGRLLGGTVIMESIFRLPGMGSLMLEAVTTKDVRVVQAGVLVISGLYVLINVLVDLGYEALDPRIRRARR